MVVGGFAATNKMTTDDIAAAEQAVAVAKTSQNTKRTCTTNSTKGFEGNLETPIEINLLRVPVKKRWVTNKCK
jgi:hypothetical protein